MYRKTNPKVESNHFVHQAIVEGDVVMVVKFLDEGGSPNVTDDHDCEPIYTAVKYDRLEIATMLLRAGGNLFRRSRFRGDAIGVACWNWNLRMIDFCVDAGVDLNDVHNGKTILDSLASQKATVSEANFPEWKATCDKLIQLGAKPAPK